MNAAFPALPDYQVHWAPIQVEPIAGSGERITVAVAALSAGGESRCVQAISESAIRCLLGRRADDLQAIIDLAVSSMRGHLAKRWPLNDWSSPLSGVSLGPVRMTHAQDMPAALRIAARNSAFVSALAEHAPDVTAEDGQSQRNKDKWAAQIEAAVVKDAEQLQPRFDHEFSLRVGARKTHIDYCGVWTAMNFSRVVPNRLAQAVRDAKSKIIDLARLRSFLHESLVQTQVPEHIELALYVPGENSPAFSDHEIANAKEAELELLDIGQFNQVTVIAYEDPTRVADHLLKLERVKRAA